MVGVVVFEVAAIYFYLFACVLQCTYMNFDLTEKKMKMILGITPCSHRYRTGVAG